jgi:hypothetical protein
MEGRHVSFDELQYKTGLCHATIHAVIHEVEKNMCALGVTGLDARIKADAGAKMS